MSSNKARAAVVGTGHLGTFHAEKYAAIEACDLVGVVDVDHERARALADRLSCKAFSSAGLPLSLAGSSFFADSGSFGAPSGKADFTDPVSRMARTCFSPLALKRSTMPRISGR